MALLRVAHIATCWAFAAFLSAPVVAQQAPLKGVVWSPPEDGVQAVRDMYAMAGSGVQAVRAPFMQNSHALAAADTLGLHIYLDLPLSRLSVSGLQDTLAYAQAALDDALSMARRHSSIRAIGLTLNSDTSDPAACALLAQLAGRLRTAEPDISTYYVTRFSRDDACADVVDFVLIDVLNRSDPGDWLDKADASSVGVGAFGVGVSPDGPRGLLASFSPARQARYFEDVLPGLLERPLQAVFVYRWRDDSVSGPSLEGRRYGLHAADGRARAAFDVISGIFSGRQTVFAFDQGEPPPNSVSWVILFGWLVILAIGTGYALSPRFRYMLPRYFRSHIFFVEAVYTKREILPGTNLVAFCALAVATGLAGYATLHHLKATYAFTVAIYYLPPLAHMITEQTLERPFLYFALAGCLLALALGLWIIAWSLLLQLGPRILRIRQVHMLVVWAHWPCLLVMALAMVASALPAPSGQAGFALAVVWLCLGLFSFAQVLVDMRLAARPPAFLLVLGALLHPLTWVFFFLLGVFFRHSSEAAFVWRAAFRQ